MIGSTPAVFLLQGPEDPMLALPDDMSPLCFGESALAHLEHS